MPACGYRYSEMYGHLYVGGHFSKSDFNQGHVVDGMLNIVGQFAWVIGSQLDGLILLNRIVGYQPEVRVWGLFGNKNFHGTQRRECLRTRRFQFAAVGAPIVVHPSARYAFLQANEKLKCMAHVLPDCCAVQGTGSSDKIYIGQLAQKFFQVCEDELCSSGQGSVGFHGSKKDSEDNVLQIYGDRRSHSMGPAGVLPP